MILGAAKIEFLLGQILDKFFLPAPTTTDDLLDGDSPLATFSAKIKVVHRIGLIDDQFCKLLNTFRRLRNGFAHEVTHSNLNSGAARDRALSLAEPFVVSEYFQECLEIIADAMQRERTDVGVIFRTVPAIFYIELSQVHTQMSSCKREHLGGIVQNVLNRTPPSKRENTDDPKQVPADK